MFLCVPASPVLCFAFVHLQRYLRAALFCVSVVRPLLRAQVLAGEQIATHVYDTRHCLALLPPLQKLQGRGKWPSLRPCCRLACQLVGVLGLPLVSLLVGMEGMADYRKSFHAYSTHKAWSSQPCRKNT